MTQNRQVPNASFGDQNAQDMYVVPNGNMGGMSGGGCPVAAECQAAVAECQAAEVCPAAVAECRAGR